MEKANEKTEVRGLQFRGLQDEIATVVTNGRMAAVYTNTGRIFVPTLARGIGYLESRGYRIDMEEWDITN